jgi:uncharacterized Fe-S cluster protein YjdI
MTDFNDWYLQQNPWIDPERDDCLAELRKAYEAGAASDAKTLRDEFAMAALANEWCSHTDECVPSDTARDAYNFADAMLEARKTTGEGKS